MPETRKQIDFAQKPVLSLVIPVFNEAGGVEETLKRARETLETVVAGHEIVVVDDGSTDSTWELIKVLSEKDPRLRLVRFTRNFGKESAILAGITYSRGKAVVVMDGDLQHPADLIGEMFRKWRDEGVDVVHAVKEQREENPWYRKIGSDFFYGLMQLFSGYRLRNATDYKLLDRSVAERYLELPEKVRFFRGLIPWLGCRNATVSFAPRGRVTGKSRWKPFDLIRMAVRAICAFSSIPLQIVTLLGGLMFLASVVLGFETLYLKLSGRAVAGFSTVILLLLFIGSLLMVSLGVIGQYIAMIYEEIKGRPAFVIDETRNIENGENQK
jgi:glycosyltransferase involved in cell wall biosynthesis